MEDAIGDLGGFGVMRDHQNGLFQLAIGTDEHLEDGFGVLCIEVAGGLVCEDDGRMGNERASYGYALLFATGELRGTVVETALNGEQIAEPVEVLPVQRLFAAAYGVGNFDIAHGGERWEQVEFLKDEADTVFAQAGALGVVQCGKIHAVNDDAAAGGLGEATEEVKERGLSGAGGADDGDEFPAADGEGDAANGGDFKLA